MNTILQGTNLDLTDDIRQLVDKKLESAYRSFGDMNLEAVQVNVELERTTRRHPQERDNEQLYRAEANVSVPGRLIRVEASAPDLTQAVVKMKNMLAREIRTWRKKMADDARRGARSVKSSIMTAPEVPEAMSEGDEERMP